MMSCSTDCSKAGIHILMWFGGLLSRHDVECLWLEFFLLDLQQQEMANFRIGLSDIMGFIVDKCD
jgi:hypothetical protein